MTVVADKHYLCFTSSLPYNVCFYLKKKKKEKGKCTLPGSLLYYTHQKNYFPAKLSEIMTIQNVIFKN